MKKRKAGSRAITIILIVILLVGAGLLCYPTFSNWWNSRTMSRAVSNYNAAVENLSREDYTAYWEEGDTFTITVLDETLTYEVDQISIILPTEYENLYIEEGEDYCTLMTCTPYGINTHRLLVRGVRTDNANRLRVTADAIRLDPIVVAPFIAIPLVIILLVWLIVSTRSNKRKTLQGKKS